MSGPGSQRAHASEGAPKTPLPADIWVLVSAAFIVAIVAVRTGARAVIGDGHALHLDAFAITDMLVALALGLFTTQRIEMYLRAKRMLETARVR